MMNFGIRKQDQQITMIIIIGKYNKGRQKDTFPVIVCMFAVLPCRGMRMVDSDSNISLL